MIRKALKEDANAIAKLVVAAMGDLAAIFRGSADASKILQLFESFVKQAGNQYSFENTLVYTIDEQVVGVINAYDGGNIDQLREPFLSYINENYHHNNFKIEVESEPGEFYIDTLSVNPDYQGKGIGKALLNAAKSWATALGHKKIGLLVDIENPAAMRLYERVGFVAAGVKVLAGKNYNHLVCEI